MKTGTSLKKIMYVRKLYQIFRIYIYGWQKWYEHHRVEMRTKTKSF